MFALFAECLTPYLLHCPRERNPLLYVPASLLLILNICYKGIICRLYHLSTKGLLVVDS